MAVDENSSRAVASVVVPAHDEAAVVLRCLEHLLAGSSAGEFEVVVAANGCTDDTVARVRSSGLPVTCLDLGRPGKIDALNAADASCSAFPRIYLDADVLLGASAARNLVELLSGAGPRAAAPRMRVDTAGCSAAVRSYYRVWTRLPVLGDGYVGSGVYAVNEEGHRRIAPFPAVTNDDEYVRRSFTSTERATSEGGFTVFPARTVAALVTRGVRTRSGQRELRRIAAPDVSAAEARAGSGSSGVVLRLARDPRHWPDLVVFCAVTAAVHWGVRRRGRRGEDGWGRDDTSRSPRTADSSTWKAPRA